MNTKMILGRIALSALTLGTIGCAGLSGPSENPSRLMPLELTSENFYALLNADLMSGSMAGTLLSLGECADNGIITITGPSADDAATALAELAHQFRVALARSGSNTFVLLNLEWNATEQNPGTVNIALQARGLICSA